MSVQNRLTNLGDVFAFLDWMKCLKVLIYGATQSSGAHLIVLPFNSKVLDVHGSSLQSIWAQGKCLNQFNNFGNVTSLNLSSYGLRSLPPGIFKGLASVLKMDLLSYLQPDLLPKSLESLNLSDNFIASPNPDALRSLLDLSMKRFYCW